MEIAGRICYAEQEGNDLCFHLKYKREPGYTAGTCCTEDEIMKRIVIDSFFHQMPGHRLSRNIATGGYAYNIGRYSPYDVFHPNGISMLYADMVGKYDVRFSNEPLTDLALADADILIMPNPDYPLYPGAAPYRIDEPDREAMLHFAQRGGSILLLINSFLSRSDFWEENFDYERILPFLKKLGIDWDPDYMSDDDEILPSMCGPFRVGYGQGGRLKGKLPEGVEPLLTWEGEVFGIRAAVGKGCVAVIGDAGLVSNGLYGFPTFDNRAFMLHLLETLEPDFGEGEMFERLDFASHHCGVSPTGITEELFDSLRPGMKSFFDHDYNHLVWEDKPVRVSVGEIELPFSLAEAETADRVTAKITAVPIEYGREGAALSMPCNVVRTAKGDRTDYLVTGMKFYEGLSWKDLGADEAVFGKIGELLTLNTVVQYMVGTEKGRIRYATLKQGQIMYDHNLKNPVYGYDILLSSRCTVYSPVRP